MSSSMYEAARRTGDNPYILHDIEAYKAAKEMGVTAEQLERMERETLELAARLARRSLGRVANVEQITIEGVNPTQH